MGYRIVLTSAARRDLSKFPKAEQRRIRRKIDSLSENPRPRGWEPVRGKESRVRVRVGRIRIIYEINDKAKLIEIARVRRRDKAYS